MFYSEFNLPKYGVKFAVVIYYLSVFPKCYFLGSPLADSNICTIGASKIWLPEEGPFKEVIRPVTVIIKQTAFVFTAWSVPAQWVDNKQLKTKDWTTECLSLQGEMSSM